MGRKVRRVPKNWKHHKDGKGVFIPLLGGSFDEADAEWSEGYSQWQKGLRESYGDGPKWIPVDEKYIGMRYTDYANSRPSPDDYMPNWPEGEATYFMMYEDTSEGTPISPGFATPEELAQWLADNGASAFANMTADYDHWLHVAKGGYAPSMVFARNQLMSGVEAL